MAIDFEAPPAALFQSLLQLSDESLEELMQEPHARDQVVDALVNHFAASLRPEKAKNLEAKIQIKLWDRPGGGYDHRELVISNGTCTVSDEPSEKANVLLKTRPTDLRAIVTGKGSPVRLALKGRLRVVGDVRLAKRITDLFDL